MRFVLVLILLVLLSINSLSAHESIFFDINSSFTATKYDIDINTNPPQFFNENNGFGIGGDVGFTLWNEALQLSVNYLYTPNIGRLSFISSDIAQSMWGFNITKVLKVLLIEGKQFNWLFGIGANHVNLETKWSNHYRMQYSYWNMSFNTGVEFLMNDNWSIMANVFYYNNFTEHNINIDNNIDQENHTLINLPEVRASRFAMHEFKFLVGLRFNLSVVVL